MLTAIDAVRLVAQWFTEGHKGSGPLSVPILAGPARTPGLASPAGLLSPDPYLGDPVGREKGLPPRVDVSRPSAVLGGGYV